MSHMTRRKSENSMNESKQQPRAAKQAAANPKQPEATITIAEFIDRERRLAGRPEMRVAFARHCNNNGMVKASETAYRSALGRFETRGKA
jgi:hypothetical protein